MVWHSATSRRVVKHRGTRTHVQVMGVAGCRCARETCTVWWIGSEVRRWRRWRSTVCWRGYCKSSATWAVTETVVPEPMTTMRTEGKVPVALKEPKEVRSDTLQTPHDPEVTYSGHKGKGYEVQVSETCEEGNTVQMITHVEVTPSSGSDAGVTVGVIDELRERGIGPSELWCDTSYGSGHNGWEAELRGTELVSPVGGRAPGEADEADEGDGTLRLTAADFDIDVTARRAAVCPAGHEAVSEYEDEDAPERVAIHFAWEMCEPCTLRSRCPVRWRRRPELGGEWSLSGAYVLSADLARVNIGRRRRAESDGQWRKRYGLRAGIEGTNSELKRRHGLGRLRVRGGERVRLAVYLKALACNIKRMIRARLAEMDEMLASPATLATDPTAA